MVLSAVLGIHWESWKIYPPWIRKDHCNCSLVACLCLCNCHEKPLLGFPAVPRRRKREKGHSWTPAGPAYGSLTLADPESYKQVLPSTVKLSSLFQLTSTTELLPSPVKITQTPLYGDTGLSLLAIMRSPYLWVSMEAKWVTSSSGSNKAVSPFLCWGSVRESW